MNKNRSVIEPRQKSTRTGTAAAAGARRPPETAHSTAGGQAAGKPTETDKSRQPRRAPTVQVSQVRAAAGVSGGYESAAD
jgi:hypothetical protein